MKNSIVLSVVFSCIFSVSLFASTITDIQTQNVRSEITEMNKIPYNFSDYEGKFFKDLDTYYYETFEKPAEDLLAGIGIKEIETKKIVVYNLEGDVITTNLDDMPTNANYLMTEGDTNYYIIDLKLEQITF